MLRRVTVGFTLLRLTALSGLALLVWNPVASRPETAAAPPLVLLDASLSMIGQGGQWRRALDTARALALGGVIWRFGAEVRPFDTLPPTDGASRLAPALAAAATRGGPVIVVTDGAIGDAAEVAPDLLAHARLVVLARPPFFDAFVQAVDGPRRVGATDTVRLTVTYGSRGPAPRGPSAKRVRLAARLGDRALASRLVALPVDGTLTAELAFPAALLPAGWSALELRLEGVPDLEPRDDARTFVLEVVPQPAVVLLAAPPDWETRFLARTLADVTRQPVRAFVALGTSPEPAWRDGATLAPASPADLRHAVAGAALVVEAGAPATFARVAPPRAVWLWPIAPRHEGDWYVVAPGPSPLAAALAGVAWDSLPPATSWIEIAPDTATTTTVLTARLARRGPPRPLVVLSDAGGRRRAIVAAGGLYRWAFRGGASGEAYRALVAAVSDWLLAEGGGGVDRFAPLALEVANGMPLWWRWTGAPPARDVVLRLGAGAASAVDTLRFDAQGNAALRLAPGAYRYAVADGRERGMVAVDRYSDEWLPTPAALAPQRGVAVGRTASVALRERWWPFVLVVVACVLEWAWRRREGLA